MTIRTSSARAIDDLVSALGSESAVTRETAVARLTVIGPRAVERLIDVVDRLDAGATARTAALRALEALGDPRALDAAERATADVDAAVAGAAVAVVRVFLKGRRGSAALDRLIRLVLNQACRETVRLDALDALGDLEPSALEPLWQALARDPSRAVRERATAARRGQPRPDAPAADQMAAAAEGELPDLDTLRRLLGTHSSAASLPLLHRIVERVREREASEPPARRSEWTRARGDGARRAGKAVESSGCSTIFEKRSKVRATALPVEFLAALSLIGDAIVPRSHRHRALRARRIGWWRDHLADAFHAIVARDG